jgi:hypothetical protein
MKLLWLLLVIPLAASCSASPTADARPNGADGIAPLMSESTDCGTAADTVKNHVQSTRIESVTVIGQCTLVVIDTSLDDEDEATAKEICESAAEVAYTGDINAVSVKSGSGAEIAQGISGARCLP